MIMATEATEATAVAVGEVSELVLPWATRWDALVAQVITAVGEVDGAMVVAVAVHTVVELELHAVMVAPAGVSLN